MLYITTKSQKNIDKSTKGIKKSLNSISERFSLKKVLSDITKGFTATAIVYGLIKVGKQAVETASDLQEVQNVVEVSFGSMSAEVDKFADNALKKFGLSKLSAKQFASRSRIYICNNHLSSLLIPSLPVLSMVLPC